MDKTIERTKGNLDSMIDRTRDVVVAAADRTEVGLESAVSRVANKAHRASEAFREGVESASVGAHRKLDQAAAAVDRGYTKARAEAVRLSSSLADCVVQHPGKSLLAVAAVGFALGLLARGRRTPLLAAGV